MKNARTVTDHRTTPKANLFGRGKTLADLRYTLFELRNHFHDVLSIVNGACTALNFVDVIHDSEHFFVGISQLILHTLRYAIISKCRCKLVKEGRHFTTTLFGVGEVGVGEVGVGELLYIFIASCTKSIFVFLSTIRYNRGFRNGTQAIRLGLFV